MVTDVIKWHRGPPASNMTNSRLLKQGQVVSMQDTFAAAKTKLGRTKPSTGPRVGHGWSNVICSDAACVPPSTALQDITPCHGRL